MNQNDIWLMFSNKYSIILYLSEKLTYFNAVYDSFDSSDRVILTESDVREPPEDSLYLDSNPYFHVDS